MKKETEIQQKIEEIKAELLSLGDMRPGSLSVQRRSWGGEYLQLSYSHRGRGYTQYVQEDNRQEVEEQLKNYKRFKELTKVWVDLSLELVKLRSKKKK